MASDKERFTNKLLFALSQRSQGMTTRELAEFIQQTTCTTCTLLRDSGYPQEDDGEESSAEMSTALWKLKKYIPGIAGDEDLKARITAGSRG